MDYRSTITQVANQLGVPPAIALAVAQKESNFQQYDSSGRVLTRVEPDGRISYGIFQLLGPTAAQMGVDPLNPISNITGGVKYLKWLYGMTGGNWQATLESYNGGIGNWQRGTVSDAAKRYALSVLAAVGMSPTTATGGAASVPRYVLPTVVVTQPGSTAIQYEPPPTIPGLTVTQPDWGSLSTLFPDLFGSSSGSGDPLLTGIPTGTTGTGSTDALSGAAVIGAAVLGLVAVLALA